MTTYISQLGGPLRARYPSGTSVALRSSRARRCKAWIQRPEEQETSAEDAEKGSQTEALTIADSFSQGWSLCLSNINSNRVLYE